MHDYHAVGTLIERLTRELAGRRGGRIERVRVRAHIAFSPEALVQAFEVLSPGTLLEGSRLVVEPSSEPSGCAKCGHTWNAEPEDLLGHWLICPSCGTPSALEGDAGIELIGVDEAGPPRSVPEGGSARGRKAPGGKVTRPSPPPA